MSGVCGIVSKNDCVQDLFYGTDYHSHLGSSYGILAVAGEQGLKKTIHRLDAPFRIKFREEIANMSGRIGIGCISDTDPQGMVLSTRLGELAMVTVARVNNLRELAQTGIKQGYHFTSGDGGFNQTEVIASIIGQARTFKQGIKQAQEEIDGSCSLLILTQDGIFAARDKLGRTPLVIGQREGGYAVASESFVFSNLGPEDNPGYKIKRYLGPGEIVFLSPEGIEQLQPPGDQMRICGFLWVYYGFPAACYEGINVEKVRYACGQALARHDSDLELDLIAGVPDSGTGHGLGYSHQSRIPYERPFAKYVETWQRSFMPQDQETRDLVARMKLTPIREIIEGKRLLFCEDSIVRGTQLQDTIRRLYGCGAVEVHMRPACPPLVYGCKFLNFSTSRDELALAARWAINKREGEAGIAHLKEYADPDSERYHDMVETIRTARLCQPGDQPLTTLRYQRLGDLLDAIGLPKEKVCTYCWDGVG